jgi:prepilin-type N-terminal cleavage/methylation domain-containing protein
MRSPQRGFTLIEIAIVLLVVTILLGYSVAMFPVQQELKRYNHANDEMNSIVEQLVAFAQVNGRLPCPDDDADAVFDGIEDRNGTNACDGYYGYLPARTLGIEGKYNAAGLLIDPWGNEYRYAVSDDPGVLTADVDLVTANDIRVEGIANVTPALFLCTDSTVVGNDPDCSTVTGGVEAIANVAAVVVSRGKSFDPGASSNTEAENTDDFLDGTTDHVFIAAPRRDDYDDIVKWVSTNLLFSKMIEADQLP